MQFSLLWRIVSVVRVLTIIFVHLNPLPIFGSWWKFFLFWRSIILPVVLSFNKFKLRKWLGFDKRTCIHEVAYINFISSRFGLVGFNFNFIISYKFIWFLLFRYSNTPFSTEIRDLNISTRKLCHHLRNKTRNRIAFLWFFIVYSFRCIIFWRIFNSITEHFFRCLFIEICINAFTFLRFIVQWNEACTCRFCK